MERGIEALEFLEKLSPPTIHAPHELVECTHMLFVPNNDLDTVKQADLKKVLTNRTVQMEKIGTEKKAKPHIVDEIQYSWKADASEPSLDRHVELLRKIAREITVLGWGIDPVTADCRMTDGVTSMPGSECYTYDRHSKEYLIDVPAEGLLEDAKRHYKEWRARITNTGFRQPDPITKFASEPYRKDMHATYDIVGFMITDIDDESKRGRGNRMQVLTDGETGKIIRWIDSEKDKAVKSVATDAESNKIKTVPLPSIGSSYADARIRRIGFLVPSHMQIHIRDTLSFLDGKIKKIGKNELQFKLLKDDGVLKAYARSSKTWCSITPLELDVEHDARRNDVLDAIRREMAGVAAEELDFINFRKEPYWGSLPKIASHRNGKFRTYVDIEFKNPARGPFVLGNSHMDGNGVLAPKTLPDVAYFTLGHHIPIEKTVTVGNHMRLATISEFPRDAIPSSISGHGEDHRALNHKHAFWLPLDANQDGLIDHIVAYLRDGFNSTERQGFCKMDALFGNNIETKLAFRGFFNKERLAKKMPVFRSADRWKSASPYFMPWHPKKKFGIEEQVKKECKSRSRLHEPEEISYNVWMRPGSREHRARNFVFNRNGQRPPNTTGYYLKVKFPERVQGPLSLGYACHFGLGMFVPDDAQGAQTRAG